MSFRIKYWRPERYDDIVGEHNRRLMRLLQSAALWNRCIAGLFLGEKGTVKTSAARLVQRSYTCEARDPVTGDGCLRCVPCLSVGTDHSGDLHGYRHWEIDCTQGVGRAEVVTILQQARQEHRALLIFDETQRLPERTAQEALLKFAEDFRGVLLVLVMLEPGEVRSAKILPALYDRLRKFRFVMPPAGDMVRFFSGKCPGWGVEAPEPLLREMVARARRSFRDCLDVLDAAKEDNGGRLTQDLLDTLLPPADTGDEPPAPWFDDE